MGAQKRLSESQVVGTSLLVSTFDVSLNFIVSLLTGSTVILAQALQGLSDLITAGILFMGTKRSRRDGDTRHPLGYGREIFFWTLIAAIVMFIGTGGLSFYFGYRQFREPQPLEDIGIAFIMLILGFSMNLYAFSRSVLRLNQNEGKDTWWRRMLRSGMIETKTTFTVDLMGTVGALFGLFSLIAYAFSGDPRFDGIGAMIIGVSTMCAAILIVVDSHGLIVGRAVSEEVTQKIARAAKRIEEVEDVIDLYTLYIGSDRLLVVIEVHLAENLGTNQIEQVMDEIKRRIRAAVPMVHRVQVEVETPDDELGPETA